MWDRFRYAPDMRRPEGTCFGYHWILFFCTGLIFLLCNCDRKKERGEAPPPPEPVVSGVCDTVSDAPVEGLVGKAHGFCLDPRSDVRRYGTFSDAPLDAVCTELFNGECELYKSYGLEGVKTLRYVAGDGSPRSINVVVSMFHRSSGAFGFFTRRILGDGTPAQRTVEPLLEVQGRAVSGVGMTYLWRGKQVVELTYVSDEETPTEVQERSPSILHPLTKAISKSLVGTTTVEKGVALLETPELDPLGAKIEQDVMGVAGAGNATVGFFSQAEVPHRVLVAERRDETGVRDLVRLLQRVGGYNKLEGRDIYVLRITSEQRPPETWYARREGNLLIGVGPLELSPAAQRSTPEQRKMEMARWKQFAVRRLMEFSVHAREFERSQGED